MLINSEKCWRNKWQITQLRVLINFSSRSFSTGCMLLILSIFFSFLFIFNWILWNYYDKSISRIDLTNFALKSSFYSFREINKKKRLKCLKLPRSLLMHIFSYFQTCNWYNIFIICCIWTTFQNIITIIIVLCKHFKFILLTVADLCQFSNKFKVNILHLSAT